MLRCRLQQQRRIVFSSCTDCCSNGHLYGTTKTGKPRTLSTVLVLPACVRKEDPGADTRLLTRAPARSQVHLLLWACCRRISAVGEVRRRSDDGDRPAAVAARAIFRLPASRARGVLLLVLISVHLSAAQLCTCAVAAQVQRCATTDACDAGCTPI